jgi:serine O-acetyltransferase
MVIFQFILVFILVGLNYSYLFPTPFRNVRRHRKLNLDVARTVHENDFSKRLEQKEQLIRELYQDCETPCPVRLWNIIQQEGKSMAKEGFRSSSLIASSLLMENSFEEAIIDFVANQLDSSLMPATQLRNIFSDVLSENRSISCAWTCDLVATTVNDLDVSNFASVVLFNQGFHSMVSYRIANSLWYSGRDSLARYFQSIVSRRFSSDIHPAARIGSGCYMSKGTQCIIGETASVGDNCCFMQGVTLGGTGKEGGDRHPKVGNLVFFGTGVTVLGNIPIEEGSVINSLSVVTKPVEAYTRVGGIPAKKICSIDKNEVYEQMKKFLPDDSKNGRKEQDRMCHYHHLHHAHLMDSECSFV